MLAADAINVTICASIEERMRNTRPHPSHLVAWVHGTVLVVLKVHKMHNANRPIIDARFVL
jgi:hypothetical protein